MIKNLNKMISLHGFFLKGKGSYIQNNGDTGNDGLQAWNNIVDLNIRVNPNNERSSEQNWKYTF